MHCCIDGAGGSGIGGFGRGGGLGGGPGGFGMLPITALEALGASHHPCEGL
jgi:hypothetical protein